MSHPHYNEKCSESFVNDFHEVSTQIYTRFSGFEIYASQTKIWENETAGRTCLFDSFCDGS